MQETLEKLPPIVFFASLAGLWTWEWLAAARRTERERGRKLRNLVLTALNIFVSATIA